MINSPHPYLFRARALEQSGAAEGERIHERVQAEKAERGRLSDNGYARLLGAFTHLGEAWRAELVAAWSQPGALTGGLNYYRASPLYPATAGDPARRS